MVFANSAAERHLGSHPASMDALLPHRLKDAAATALATGDVTTAEAETGSPARVLRGGPAHPRRLDRPRRRRRHADPAPRADPARLRRERVARAEDPRRLDPGRRRNDPDRGIRGPSVVPRFAAQLEREAARLARIVSDLLDLSRLETGSDLDESVALDAVVRDESERFEDPAAEAGVALDVSAERVPRVRGSGRDLALLVRNLVDNAIRYTRPGGRPRSASGAATARSC